MNKDYVVIGSGGHARVLIAALKAGGIVPVACLDSDPSRWNGQVLGVTVTGDDSTLPALGKPDHVLLVNGVGSAAQPEMRRAVWEKFLALGYRFASVTDPRAIVSEGVSIDPGAQILAAAVVQPGTRIGSNAIINTGACVDHDCSIGSHAHIAPGAVLCGNVDVGESAHIGAGAIIRQGARIGHGAVVGMGAVVISDIEDHAVVGGIPARALHATGAST